jgi:hypothetical protein
LPGKDFQTKTKNNMGQNFLKKISDKVADKFEDIKERKFKQMISDFVAPLVEPKINDFFDHLNKLQINGRLYNVKFEFSNDIINAVVSHEQNGLTTIIISIHIERGDLLDMMTDFKKIELLISQIKDKIENNG